MIFSISSFNKCVCLILFVLLLPCGQQMAVQAAEESDRFEAPVAGRTVITSTEVGEIKVIGSGGQVMARDSGLYAAKRETVVSIEPLPEPLVAETEIITWSLVQRDTESMSYTFEIERDGTSQGTISTGSNYWLDWLPDTAGRYRVRAMAEDASGRVVTSPWSEVLEVVPGLAVGQPVADLPSPQVAHSRAVSWAVTAKGGAGALSYVFYLEDEDHHIAMVRTDDQAAWSWYPDRPGSYRVRVEVTDEQGHQVLSPWSTLFRIEPRMEVDLAVGLSALGMAAVTNRIPLDVRTSGGVGTLSRQMMVERDGRLIDTITVEDGQDVSWTPDAPGTYRIRLLVTDTANNQVASPWSAPIEIAPELKVGTPVPNVPMPRMAEGDRVTWTVAASGGAGNLSYVFYQRQAEGEAEAIPGEERNSLVWQPDTPGEYQMKVTVEDETGSRVESDWSEPYLIVPALTAGEVLIVPALAAGEALIEEEGDQFEQGTALRFSVESSGGIGDKTYHFQLQEEEEQPMVLQSIGVPELTWQAKPVGFYRMRVIVEDAMGHRKEGLWSKQFEIVGDLALKGLAVSPPSPQKALSGPVKWTIEDVGAIGAVSFTFELIKGGQVIAAYEGTEREWLWHPRTKGIYRVRVTAVDEAGRTAFSSVSPDYVVTAAIDRDSLLTVFPVENLSGVKAPQELVRTIFNRSLKGIGFDLLDDETLNAFLKKNRLRYVGGIGSRAGKALQDETEVDAVFIISMETYQESGPPKISLVARLVMCRVYPEIAWMESVGMTGDEAPGFLELGLIWDDNVLMEKAVKQLMDSFARYLEEPSEASDRKARLGGGGGSYAPRSFYRSKDLDMRTFKSVSVLPFVNRYARKNSGYVLPLHLIKKLVKNENLSVIEPGLIREALLKYRIVMEGGPSLSVADVIGSQRTLQSDLLVAGSVFDYQGLRGEPKVHFSVQVVETSDLDVVWWSNSHASGSDGVFFFDMGTISSAHGLTDRLTGSIVSLLMGKPRQ